MPKTIQQLAQEALQVQNACNLVAVLNAYAKAVSELREIVSWDEAYQHPIAQVWADKVASLTGTQGYSAIGAFNKVHDLAGNGGDE